MFTANDPWLIADHCFLPLQADHAKTGASSGVAHSHMQENIRFEDAEMNQMEQYANNSFLKMDQDTDEAAGLAKFLSRPVRVDTTTWTEGVFLTASFNPWKEYFNHPVIKRKLENYSRLRCTLHLKFVINASPFYYGIARACYFPYSSNLTYNGAEDQVPFSQTPGIYLEPSKMSAAEMTLPFLWPLTFIDVNQASHFDAMGTIQLIEYTGLRSANGVSGTGVTITTFAWAEDVEVAGPTTALALQADEYEETDGVISQPATVVAKISSMLTEAPYIGPFAKATEIGATAVASIAKIFGYSNPPVIEDCKPYHPKSFHAFANVETRMPIDKLCLDPKNEVTLDNSIIGGEAADSLSFANTVMRESFVRGTLWTGAYTPGTPLFTINVTPAHKQTRSVVPNSIYFYTPAGYFSEMFEQWRGSMIYKFKFIKSQYHKGRVLISWDPEKSLIGESEPETAVFTRIVDLEHEDEVEMEIPYKSPSPFLYARTRDTITNSTSPTLPLVIMEQNGCIQMRVLNVLTGPAANPEIDVLVYSRPGKDIQFARPINPNNALTTLPLQGDEINVADSSKPLDFDINKVTMGESMVSLRPLAHRVCYHMTQPLGTNRTGASTWVASGHIFTTNILPRIPRPYGLDPFNGYHWADLPPSKIKFNYVSNHPLRWILNCFVGYRGSTNVHVNVVHYDYKMVPSLSAARSYDSGTLNPTQQNVNRFTLRVPFGSDSSLARASSTYSSFPQGNISRRILGLEGLSITNTNTQSALSVNLPQYNRLKFYTAKYFASGTEGTQLDYEDSLDNLRISSYFQYTDTASANTPWPTMDVYYGGGVDFNPVFFVCCPPIWDYGAPNPDDSWTPS